MSSDEGRIINDSIADLERLEATVKFLSQNIQRQQQQIMALQKWLASACFFLIFSIGAIVWLFLR